MPVVASPKKSQINARIDTTLKLRGDRGLAAAGLTPTQAVTALWKLAASSESDPDRITEALFPNSKDADEKGSHAKIHSKRQLLAGASSIIEDGLRESVLVWTPKRPDAQPDFYGKLKDSSREEAYRDYLGEE